MELHFGRVVRDAAGETLFEWVDDTSVTDGFELTGLADERVALVEALREDTPEELSSDSVGDRGVLDDLEGLLDLDLLEEALLPEVFDEVLLDEDGGCLGE